MTFQDQNLQCVECGKTFIFTAQEQIFYQKKEFQNLPKRCVDCRAKKKFQQSISSSKKFKQNTSSESLPSRQPVSCSRCGKLFVPPFDPKVGMSIFCRECYKK